jgi:shikimate dehydrogenase
LQIEFPNMPLSYLPITERVSNDANDSVNASTRYCAVFGHPVRHSASPAMQNAGLAALGLNWRYLAFDVHPDHLRPAIEGARRMGFIGLNLTVPHKLLALEMVDVLDDQARTWGAVNTIVFETRDPSGAMGAVGRFGWPAGREVRSRGFNTDADAIVQALKEDLTGKACAGRRVLLLGAGGAARAAALRLAREGWRPFIWSTAPSRGRPNSPPKLAKSCPGTRTVLGYPSESVDLVINATSLGLKAEDPLPIDPNGCKRKPSAICVRHDLSSDGNRLAARGPQARAAAPPTAPACCSTKGRGRWNCGRAARRPSR